MSSRERKTLWLLTNVASRRTVPLRRRGGEGSEVRRLLATLKDLEVSVKADGVVIMPVLALGTGVLIGQTTDELPEAERGLEPADRVALNRYAALGPPRAGGGRLRAGSVTLEGAGTLGAGVAPYATFAGVPIYLGRPGNRQAPAWA